MLNIEKYEKEILDIGLSNFAYTKDNEIKRCVDIYCCDCIFRVNNTCSRHKTAEWLASEYKEPILSDVEKTIINETIKNFKMFTDKRLLTISKLVSSVNEVYLQFKYDGEYYNTLSFNKDFRFQGMEINEKYTLKDLGLC